MSVDVDLQDVLLASTQMSGIASTYGTVGGQMSGISSLGDVFETGACSGPWTAAAETLWGYFADSQDNLNDCSRTLVRYINAVCARDSTSAEELQEQIEDYNTAQGNTGDDDMPVLPETDPTNPNETIPEPDYEEADRP